MYFVNDFAIVCEKCCLKQTKSAACGRLKAVFSATVLHRKCCLPCANRACTTCLIEERARISSAASSEVASRGLLFISTHTRACSSWPLWPSSLHLETHVSLRSSQGHRVMFTLFRKCGMLQWSSTSPGRGCGSVLAWLVRQCQGLRAREAQRSELMNNRTYPWTSKPRPAFRPLRCPPGLIQGGFNNPVVLVGHSPQPEPSCAWRLPPSLLRLNRDHKFSPERVSVCSCFLRCLWLSHFIRTALTARAWQQTNTHTQAQTHINQVCVERQTCDSVYIKHEWLGWHTHEEKWAELADSASISSAQRHTVYALHVLPYDWQRSEPQR